MQVFVIMNKNADVNVKNELTKECVIMDLFEILVIASVNAINHVMLENIQIIKILSAEKV